MRQIIFQSETVFIDDREKNVHGAKALGLHAILYKNNDQAMTDINQYISRLSI